MQCRLSLNLIYKIHRRNPPLVIKITLSSPSFLFPCYNSTTKPVTPSQPSIPSRTSHSNSSTTPNNPKNPRKKPTHTDLPIERTPTSLYLDSLASQTHNPPLHPSDPAHSLCLFLQTGIFRVSIPQGLEISFVPPAPGEEGGQGRGLDQNGCSGGGGRRLWRFHVYLGLYLVLFSDSRAFGYSFSFSSSPSSLHTKRKKKEGISFLFFHLVNSPPPSRVSILDHVERRGFFLLNE